MLAVLAYLVAAPLVVLHLSRHAPVPAFRCLSMSLLNRPCPLCGWSRGLDALLHGDAVTATAMNPLIVPAAVLVVINLVYRSIALFGHPPLSRWRWTRRVDGWGHLAAVAVYFGYAIVFYAA